MSKEELEIKLIDLNIHPLQIASNVLSKEEYTVFLKQYIQEEQQYIIDLLEAKIEYKETENE